MLTRAFESRNCVLNGSLWPKYVMFELQNYRGVVFHDTEKSVTDMWFEKWHEKFGKLSPELLKVSKLRLWWDSSVQSRKGMTLTFTEELCVMTIKDNAKFEEELTCHFKTDMRNLTNFDSSTRKSKKKLLFNWLLWPSI